MARARALRLSPSQAHELPHAGLLLLTLPLIPPRVVADRATQPIPPAGDSRGLHARAAVPTQRDEAPMACPVRISSYRDQAKRLWASILSDSTAIPIFDMVRA